MGHDRKRQPGRFIMVSHSLLNSPAFIALPCNAQRLFLDLRLKLNGGNNGDVSAALSDLKHRGWRSPSTLAKALRQLEALGFLVRTRQTPGVEHGSRICNLYAFTDQEVRPLPHKFIASRAPSFDYAKFKSVNECRAIAREAARPKKKTPQKLDRHATESVCVLANDATDCVEESFA
jgi:hypothetical protein